MDQAPIRAPRWLGAGAALVALYIVAIRLQVAADAPLWMDETWSAMIATRPDWAAFWHEAWLDCNPPLYYVFLHGWVSVFGDSNAMLRLPSILFVLAAAALPLIWRPVGLTRSAAVVWAALILLWPQGLALMLDARSYGLMLLLSVASTLVLAKLLEDLSLQWAAVWVALGTLMFLTHYFAAALVIAQTLVLARRYGLEMVRVWPAALLALPGLAWFVHHFARLQDYARGDVVWQQTTTADGALGHAMYLLGAVNPALSGIIVVIVIAALVQRDRAIASPQNLAASSSTAVIGFAVALLIGVLQASLVSRYLVPLVPPAMLGLTLVFQRSARPHLYGAMLLAVFLPPALNAKQASAAAEMRAVYGFEKASDFVGKNRADQVVFLWDHPAAKILDRKSLAQLGGYFLRRQGLNLPVRTVIVPESADANAVLRQAATGARPAVIWLYNRTERTSARTYLPSFANDPAWSCHNPATDFGLNQQLGAIACVKPERDSD